MQIGSEPFMTHTLSCGTIRLRVRTKNVPVNESPRSEFGSDGARKDEHTGWFVDPL